jgi:hypothetical protein
MQVAKMVKNIRANSQITRMYVTQLKMMNTLGVDKKVAHQKNPARSHIM